MRVSSATPPPLLPSIYMGGPDGPPMWPDLPGLTDLFSKSDFARLTPLP